MTVARAFQVPLVLRNEKTQFPELNPKDAENVNVAVPNASGPVPVVIDKKPPESVPKALHDDPVPAFVTEHVGAVPATKIL